MRDIWIEKEIEIDTVTVSFSEFIDGLGNFSPGELIEVCKEVYQARPTIESAELLFKYFAEECKSWGLEPKNFLAEAYWTGKVKEAEADGYIGTEKAMSMIKEENNV